MTRPLLFRRVIVNARWVQAVGDQLITEIKLANFKPFGQGPNECFRTAPLSKINLVYGPNSAGKSSLVQSLLLLKQSIEERSGPGQLTPTGAYCDLGNFDAIVHQHEASGREASIALRYEGSGPAWSTQFSFAGNDLSDLILSRYVYERSSPNPTKAKLEIDLSLTDQNSATPTYTVSKNFNPKMFNGYLSDRDGRSDRYGVLMRQQDIELVGKLLPHMLVQPRGRNLIPTQPAINRGLDNRVADIRDRLRVLDSQIDNFGRRTAHRRDMENERTALNQEWESLQLSPRDRQAATARIDDAINIALRQTSDDVIDRLLSNISYLGPVRFAPQRVYRASGNQTTVGVTGEHIFNTLSYDSGMVDRINDYLKAFEIGYTVDINRSDTDRGLGTNVGLISLIDRHSNVAHSIVDVGFGISQILPTIIEALAGKSQVLCVDEPEIHMHPRLQAKVADLMVDTALDPRNPKQWIVETHSELLARRLQTRIYAEDLTPEDISVLYIDPPRTGRRQEPDTEVTSSYIRRINLDDEGDWLDQWPQGFFEEGFRGCLKRV